MQKTLKMAINYNEKKVFSTRVKETINVSTSCTIKTKRSSNLQLWKINKERKKMEENSSDNLDKYISIEYPLESYHRSNQDTCLLHKPSVFEGQWVERGDLLADCSASVGGELSLGQNILIGYMPWEGYNFEDAILISERLVYDDLYTSIHIERYEVTVEETKLGIEEITREIPEVQEKSLRHLNSLGIAKIGSWIEEGDILIGKVTPINKKNQSNYQKLLYLILDKTISPVCDSSLRAPKGIKAKVIGIQLFKKNQNNILGVPLYSQQEVSRYETNQNEKMRYPVLQSLKTSSISLSNIKKIKGELPLSPSPFTSPPSPKGGAFSPCPPSPFGGQGEGGKGGIGTGEKNQKSILKKKNKFTTPPIQARMGKLDAFSELSNKKSQNEVNSINDSQLSNLYSNDKKQQIESFSYSDTNLFISPSISPLPPIPVPVPFEEPPFSPFTFPPKGGMGIGNVKGEASKKKLRFFLQDGEREIKRRKEKNPFFAFRSSSISNDYYNKFIKKNIRTNFLLSKKKFSNKDQLQKKISSPLPLVTKINNFREGKKEKNQKTLLKNISSIQIYLAERRRVQVGDKMAGRHGNKGIISEILPIEDLPYLPDGTPLDMVLNPLGVPSRMNVGQIYECLLGLAGKHLGENFKIFPFDESYGAEASRSFVYSKLYNASVKTGKTWLFNPNFPGKLCLYDGRTGESFHQAITVGYAYILRLVHMVDDKMHCLTPDHDVLTTKGWVGIEKITCKDKIATLQKNGQLVYQKPTNIFHYKDYKGSLYHIKNNTIDLMVTPNHRMYVKKNLFPFSSKKQSLLENKKKEARAKKVCKKKHSSFLQYELIEAKNLIGKNYKYLKKAKWIQQDYQFVLPSVQFNSLTTSLLIKKNNCNPTPITSLPLSVPHCKKKLLLCKKSKTTGTTNIAEKKINMTAWLIFFGLWISKNNWFSLTNNELIINELCYSHSNMKKLDISNNFIKKKNSFFLLKLLKTSLNQLGYKYKKMNQKLYIKDYQLCLYLKKLTINFEKQFLPSWIWELSKKQSQLLLSSIMLSSSLYKSKNYNFFYKLLFGFSRDRNKEKNQFKNHPLRSFFFKRPISPKDKGIGQESLKKANLFYKRRFKKKASKKNRSLFLSKGQFSLLETKSKTKKTIRLTTKNIACFSTSKLKLTNNSLNLKSQNSSTHFYTPYFKLADELMRLALHAGWSANKSISVTRSPFFPISFYTGDRKQGPLKKNVAFFYKGKLALDDFINNSQCIQNQWQISIIMKQKNLIFNNQVSCNKNNYKSALTQNSVVFSTSSSSSSSSSLSSSSSSSFCYKTPVISPLTVFIEQPKNLLVQTLNYSNLQIEEFIPYIGSVFCLTVPNEVFYIRRNGYSVWTGNSRSTGPYSLVTQQPLRGRSKHGGQRLGEMEVWALEGYGAAFTLLEMLTIKSDDMSGRMTLWSNLILNKEISIGTPESFKVLICELQALCLDIGLFRMIPSKSKLGATPT